MNFKIKNMKTNRQNRYFWPSIIVLLVLIISILHYSTSTHRWQYHLIFMQSYFIPILIAAFQYGIKGGLGTAVAVSLIYLPHIMLQWGGLAESNLMRFLQIVLFNVIGYLTGLKAGKEKEEKERFQKTAEELQVSLNLLKEQSEKLEDLEEKLRQTDRLALVGELTASMAHEVRNPLGSIRGTVEILRDELPEDARNSEFFQILLQETERLNRVVENFLSVSRKQSSQKSVFDLREVIHNTNLLLRSRVRKVGIDIRLQLPDFPFTVEAVADHWQQVLLNLLLNAIQAMPDGGEITVRLEKVSPKQDVTENSEGENKTRAEEGCLIIRDQGSGIPREVIGKIFQPFYTTKPEGTGLGLAIVKRIADKNRWRIEMESKVGSGTKFLLYFPVAPVGTTGYQ